MKLYAEHVWLCKIAPLALVIAQLTACVLQQTPDVVETVLSDLEPEILEYAVPDQVHQSLQPETSVIQDKSYYKRLDIEANETPAQSFFNSIASAANMNVMVDPNIKGNITLSMKDVTLNEILSAIRDSYGYDYRATEYGYRILDKKLQSKVYNLDYLNVKREGNSEIQVSGGSIKENVGNSEDSAPSGASMNKFAKIYTSSVSNFWVEIKTILQEMVGTSDGRQIFIDPHVGIVMVRAYPNELANVEVFLNATQKSLQQQVVIEARVIEVQLKDGYEQGIDWGTFGSGMDSNATFATNLTGFTPKNRDAIGGIFGISFNYKNDFSGFIKLLKTQGDVKVLSSPRISTINNQKAVIKVGTDEFFVTDVSSATTTTATSSTTSQSPQIKLTPFFSGIALDVTPQIGGQGDITLHVHPSVTEVVEQVRTFSVNGSDMILPLALSTVREADAIIRARTGQVVVIGGLLQNKLNDIDARVPLLSDIPLLGVLFTQKKQIYQKVELVILLKPQIVDETHWHHSIKELKEKFPFWQSEQTQHGLTQHEPTEHEKN